MRIPVIRGTIARRILVNYRVAPDLLQRQLPPPFRPKLHDGHGVAGICLIRLSRLRPRGLPAAFGISSENAAHRVAVEWDTDDGVREGVYIARRDSSSRLNALAGGRLFPGVHHLADFECDEHENHVSVTMRSRDGEVSLHVKGRVGTSLQPGSMFESLEHASAFFEGGSLGYSPSRDTGRYDGLELRTHHWQVQPLHVDDVMSSVYNDQRAFPSGSVDFDCALLIRNIDHEWHSRECLACHPD